MDFDTLIPVARGAMGTVYRTRDPATGETIAVKRIRRGDEATRTRTRREAEAQRALDHPYVCRIHDIIDREDEQVLVMEYVDGVPLGVALPELDLDQRLRLLLLICEGVAHAHDRAVIHRDLKPSNILVVETPEGHLPKIVDFGLARLDDSETVTATGDIVGTPAFMAPEQARGETAIDRRADVYALGTILYLMLTDRRPCSGSQAEVLAQVRSGRFPVPTLVRPSVPEQLERICLRALGHARAARYPDAGALARDLGSYLASGTVRAPGAWRWKLARGWRDRHREILGTGAVAAALLGLVAALSVSEQRARERARIAAEFTRMAEDAAGRFRLLQMVPAQDLAAGRARVRGAIEEIRREAAVIGGAAAEAAAFAAGRLAVQLGAFEVADTELVRAGDAPVVAYWRGLALAALYRDRVRDALVVRDREERQRRLAAAERELRQPALALLAREDTSAAGVPGLARGILALTDGRYDAAREALEAMLALTPWRFEGLVLIGESFELGATEDVLGGRWEAALEAHAAAEASYRRALELAPSAGEAHLRLCALLARNVEIASYHLPASMGEVAPPAQAACAAARSNDSGAAMPGAHLAAIHLHRARIAMRSGGDFEPPLQEALSAATAALALDPSLGEGWLRLANIHRMLSFAAMDSARSPEAAVVAGREAIGKALALEPRNPRFLNTAANLELDLAEWQLGEGQAPHAALQRAIALLEQASTLRPEDATLLGNLAVARSIQVDALIDAGQPFAVEANAAMVTYARAEALNPNDAFIPNSRGVLRLHIAQALPSGSQEALAAAEAAVGDARRAVELAPDDALRHYNHGAALRFLAVARHAADRPWQGDVSDAALALERALELKPGDPDSLILLARVRMLEADSQGGGSEAAQVSLAAAGALLDAVDRTDYKDLALTRLELQARRALADPRRCARERDALTSRLEGLLATWGERVGETLARLGTGCGSSPDRSWAETVKPSSR